MYVHHCPGFGMLKINHACQAGVLTQMARDQSMSGIIRQVLNVPVTCHPKHFPSEKYKYGNYQQKKDASIMDSPMMDWFWDQYLPNAEPHVYATPLLARDLSNLAPARMCHRERPAHCCASMLTELVSRANCRPRFFAGRRVSHMLKH